MQHIRLTIHTKYLRRAESIASSGFGWGAGVSRFDRCQSEQFDFRDPTAKIVRSADARQRAGIITSVRVHLHRSSCRSVGLLVCASIEIAHGAQNAHLASHSTNERTNERCVNSLSIIIPPSCLYKSRAARVLRV